MVDLKKELEKCYEVIERQKEIHRFIAIDQDEIEIEELVEAGLLKKRGAFYYLVK